MPHFICPKCEYTDDIPSAMLGQQITCMECKHSLTMPINKSDTEELGLHEGRTQKNAESICIDRKQQSHESRLFLLDFGWAFCGIMLAVSGVITIVLGLTQANELYMYIGIGALLQSLVAFTVLAALRLAGDIRRNSLETLKIAREIGQRLPAPPPE